VRFQEFSKSVVTHFVGNRPCAAGGRGGYVTFRLLLDVLPLFFVFAVAIVVIVGGLRLGPKRRMPPDWPQVPVSSGRPDPLRFYSMTKWMVMWCGLIVATCVTVLPSSQGWPFLVLGVSVVVAGYMRPRGAAQRCYVDPNSGAITLARGKDAIPLDLSHFQYVRVYYASGGRGRRPGVLVLSHDTQPTGLTWLRSIFLPCFDGERVVLFYASWWDGWTKITTFAMDDLFRQACVRAGRPPVDRGWQFFGGYGWEVHPGWAAQ
jgi:hypothetical protein